MGGSTWVWDVLATGLKLGPYEIVTPVGAGGMGEVYRARDPRLGRDVAVKIIAAIRSSDPRRLRLFEQEARAVAALNHPNILAVYDIGLHDGCPYIVTELLEGGTLRERLCAGPVLVRKAIDYTIQITGGLAAAHDKGIVHRDLKPENVFLTRDGRVKILDFGLAKLTNDEVSGVDVTHTIQSDSGTVVGTAGYMAPEQARGKPADARTDLFALGAILYEMLSGQRAFKGDSLADTIAAILAIDPPELRHANPQVSTALERIVLHCLEKNPEERFQSARDVGFDLEMLSSASGITTTTAGVVPKNKRQGAIGAAIIAAVLIVVVVLRVGMFTKTTATLPEYQQLTFRRGTVGSGKFAPDGQVVYSAWWDGGQQEIFTVGSVSHSARATSIRDANIESISSSGEMLLIGPRHWITGFGGAVRPGTLSRAPLSGAAPRSLLDDVDGAGWSPDGRSFAIARYIGQHYRLEFPVGRVLYESNGSISSPRVSPKGDLVAFLDHPLFGDDRGSVAVVDLGGHKRTLSPEFASARRLEWRNGDEVWFSASKEGMATDLYAVNLAGRMRTVLRVPGGVGLLDIGRDGCALITQGHERWSVAVLGPGQKTERDLSIADLSVPRDLSPDGQMLLEEEEAEGPQNAETYSVYLRKLDGSPPVRLGEGAARALSPDGKWALVATLRSPAQLVLLPTGVGEVRQVTHDSIDHWGGRFLPDGNRIVFRGVEPGHSPRVYEQAIDGEIGARPLTPEGVSGDISVSPDGNLLAVSGGMRTWLVPSSGGEPRVVTAIHPGEVVAGWALGGHALYAVRGWDLPGQLFRIEIDSGRREPVKQLAPADRAGVQVIDFVLVTPDLRTVAYGFNRTLTEMYVVRGLK